MLIIGITGMPGAGKTTAAKGLEPTGFSKIAMGDMIREETKRRNLYPDDRNMGSVMRELRERYGAGAVAELTLRSIDSMKENRAVVIDGIRSLAEVDIFSRMGKVRVLAIWASPARRFELLRARGRSDDPQTVESFDARDQRELSIGIGGAIALADDIVSNERLAIDELGAQTLDIVRRWITNVE